MIVLIDVKIQGDIQETMQVYFLLAYIVTDSKVDFQSGISITKQSCHCKQIVISLYQLQVFQLESIISFK